jgi:asparagine N-glycosylation enzyme membrane subunit Stt3
VQRHLRTAQRAVPTVWLNLLCLDAPLVSTAWLWLFARTFYTPVDPVNCAALFLTAWLIYLADRLADSSSLPDGGPRSLRHEFCLNHRQIWIAALAAIAATDAVLIWNRLGSATLLAGAVVGTVALLHLVLNYSLGGAWPPLPLKEVAVGSLFAAGTLVALFPVRPIIGSLVISGMVFACLCTLNCISIAFWERELDEKQRKVSFATRYPDLHQHLGKFAVAFALGSGLAAIVWREAAPVFGCVGVSSLLLALLDSFRAKIGPDQRTALADLVLLTPLLALLIMNA